MLPTELRHWAIRHHVSLEALAELSTILGADNTPASSGTSSEARVQSQVRLAAPYVDMKLWRNNVGAIKDDRGVPVRYGLANDTPALNKRLKSSDLIGWRRRVITPADVGTAIAQFATLECKHEGWTYRGDDHEEAQQRWISLVVAEGGYGRFITRAEQLGC